MKAGTVLPDGILFRRALPGDAPCLAQLRLDFMRLVKNGGQHDEEAWRTELEELFSRDLDRGSLVCWVCAVGNRLVGASGVAFGDRAQAPVRAAPVWSAGEAGSSEALILNMYTVPEYRRRGIAGALLDRCIGEARTRGVGRLRLQPTEEGRRLYEGRGFRTLGEDMVLDLA